MSSLRTSFYISSHHLERDDLTSAALGRFGRRRRCFRQGRIHEAAHLVCGLELHMVCDMGVRIQCEPSTIVSQLTGYTSIRPPCSRPYTIPHQSLVGDTPRPAFHLYLSLAAIACYSFYRRFVLPKGFAFLQQNCVFIIFGNIRNMAIN